MRDLRRREIARYGLDDFTTWKFNFHVLAKTPLFSLVFPQRNCRPPQSFWSSPTRLETAAMHDLERLVVDLRTTHGRCVHLQPLGRFVVSCSRFGTLLTPVFLLKLSGTHCRGFRNIKTILVARNSVPEEWHKRQAHDLSDSVREE